MGIVLVTGPARSGKSEWAENLALKSNNCVIYLATALVNLEDLDWVERLSKHQKRRPEHWLTWEVPELQLISAIATSPASSCLLVDSLGTWVAALLDKDATQWEQNCSRVVTYFARSLYSRTNFCRRRNRLGCSTSLS